MIDNALQELIDVGYSDLTVMINDDPETDGDLVGAYIKAFYGPGKIFEANITFSNEGTVALGTAGATYNTVKQKGCSNSVVIPSDTFFPFNQIKNILDFHFSVKSEFTWVVTSKPGRYAQNEGRLIVNGQSKLLVQNLEGSNLNPEFMVHESCDRLTSAGVIVVNNLLFARGYEDFIREFPELKNKAVDIYRTFIPWLLTRGQQIYTYDIAEPIADLGTPDRLFGIRNNRLY